MSLETRHGKTLEEMEEPTKIDTKGVIVTIATIRPTTEQPIEKFTPGWRLLCAFTSIAIVNLVCALDATIVVVALPVRAPIQQTPPIYLQVFIDVRA